MGRRVPVLGVWMILAIVSVGVLAFMDERREASAALEDFAGEQTRIATALSAALLRQLHAFPGDAPDEAVVQVLGRAGPLEEPGTVLLLVRPPGQRSFYGTGGGVYRSDPLAEALDGGQKWVRLTREQAATLGLSERTAMAGLSTFDGPSGRGGIAVVASAQRQRDREARAERRLVLSVALASGLVLFFGGLAVRRQRKQLELQRELEVAELQRERDAHLVRADKLATMGALATGVAHEISTPLGVIVGRAEQVLARVQGDEKGSRAVQAILEQSERISRVIRGFLGLARGEAPSLERVDPAEVARKATELVQHRFAKAGVRLDVDVAMGLSPITCEPRLFEQAVVNLLLNACDACTPGGTVALRVGADEDRVSFVVVDDGAGISPQVAARATEPFFTTKPAGTGLGLAIANEIAKHHRGSFTIAALAPTPARAHGTRACIEIPTSPRVVDARASGMPSVAAGEE